MKDKAILALLVAACVIIPGYFVLFPVSSPTVSASVPFAPIKVSMQGSTVLAYELEFSDFDRDDMSISGVNVYCVDNGTLLQEITGDYLLSTFHKRTIPAPTEKQLWDGTGKLLHSRLTIFLTVANGSGLTALRHEFTFARYGSTVHIAGPAVSISQNSVPVIRAPVNGDIWGAFETSIATSHHIAAQFTVEGVTRCPQRYAVDFVTIDSNGQFFSGDGKNNTDYFCYGAELVAVADGVVTYVKNDVWENTPPNINSNLSFGLIGGNMVILDIGGGNYVQYAHAITGSICVSVGQHVTAGQVLGLLGNSGNSDSPHLHFQLGTNATGILEGEGLPYLIDNFTVNGRITAQGSGFSFAPVNPAEVWLNTWYRNMERVDLGNVSG